MPPYVVVPMRTQDPTQPYAKLVLPIDALKHVDSEDWTFHPEDGDAYPTGVLPSNSRTINTLRMRTGLVGPVLPRPDGVWDFRECNARVIPESIMRAAQEMATLSMA